MSRPKPKIIMEYADPKTYESEQILEADAIFAVFYNGKPINVRTVQLLANVPGPRYTRVSYSNVGHAFNLADKLNEVHKTDQFQVYRLDSGSIVDKDQE